jgi:hypothetical protein
LRDLAGILRNAIEAVSLHVIKEDAMTVPKKIFIGHGRSEHWRVLKDFVRDRLTLDFEEFNRISPAGIRACPQLVDSQGVRQVIHGRST